MQRFNLLLCLWLIFVFSVQHVAAQNPPIYSHFFANPFQFNPSYAGHNGFVEANLFYRKQWLDINNAPTSMSFNLQAPIGRNVSLAFSANSDETILLSNTSLAATFAYIVRLGSNHNLNFGLTSGMGFNKFDFDEIQEVNDPTLAGVVENNSYFLAQFGINYRYKNFNVGFALPKLFDSKPNSQQEFNDLKFSEFENKFASISYTMRLGDLELIPTGIYRSIDNYQDQLEGMLIAKYKNLFWLGGSYRDNYGVTGFIGINIKGLFRVGYANEQPTGNLSQLTGGTHEFYLGARLGKRNREEEILAEQSSRDSVKTTTAVAAASETLPEEETTETELSTNDEPTAPIATESQTQSPPMEEPAAVAQPPAMNEAQKAENSSIQVGYYVILGVYSHGDNAIRQTENLRESGLKPGILFVPEKNFYYVYTFYSTVREEAVTEWKNLRRQNKYFGAWLFSREQEP